MGQTSRRVAVIGAGPSGLAATKALSDEDALLTIRVFERRDRVGGIWLYDRKPDVFLSRVSNHAARNNPPPQLPALAPPIGDVIVARTGMYEGLDSNVGAKVMAFTHTPFPKTNSASSTRQFGPENPTWPRQAVADYIEDGFIDYLHLLRLNTTVERIGKASNEWVLTLQKANVVYRGQNQDYWWQEKFDAVVITTGHYSVPFVPPILGIDEITTFPDKFEHSKSFRSADNYVGKKVVIVGGNISAGDLIEELSPIVKGPLYVSRRGQNEALEAAFSLDNVTIKPPVRQISTDSGGTIEFEDGTKVENFDKIIFATRYRVSYPFLDPDPVTPQNRLAGFYQHIFKIGNPSLAIIGQVKAAISFRVFEYQAVAVARFLAGRAQLPSMADQKEWETNRIVYKGPTNSFHEIKPDFEEYFNYLWTLAGSPVEGTKGYEFPAWDEK